jgi:hypothetical protein
MKKYIIYLLVLCSSVLLAQNKKTLAFKESIYSVEIQIENGKDFLELNKENKIQIVTKHIEPVNMVCTGQNLKRGELSTDKNVTNMTVTINKEALLEGKYALAIAFRGRKGKLFQHEFLIPVK